MLSFSTGLRNAIISNYGLGIMMNGGVICVYSGTIPTSPDYAPSGTLLGRITTDGLTFIPGDPSSGAGLIVTLVSPGSLMNLGNWRLVGLATGTASWFRWYWSDPDPTTYSTSYPRVDGLVGSDLILESTIITPTTNKQIDQFLITL